MFEQDYNELIKKINGIERAVLNEYVTTDCINIRKIESLNKILDSMILYYNTVFNYKETELNKASDFLKYIHKSILEVKESGMATEEFIDVLLNNDLNSVIYITDVANVNHYISDNKLILSNSSEEFESYYENETFEFDEELFSISASKNTFVTFLKFNNIVGTKNIVLLTENADKETKSATISITNKKTTFLKLARNIKKIKFISGVDSSVFEQLEILFTKQKTDIISSFIIYEFNETSELKFSFNSVFKYETYLLKKSIFDKSTTLYNFVEENKNKLIKIKNVFEVENKLTDYYLVTFFSTDERVLDIPKIFSL